MTTGDQGIITQPDWHALSAADVLSRLSSDPSRGLSATEVQRRLLNFGPNALPEPRRKSLVTIFLHQFQNPLVYLLVAAAAVAFFVAGPKDAVVILTVVLLNAALGAFQEGRAERSLQALRKLTAVQARLLRDSTEVLVNGREVVPGDVLLLAAGDAVAADARMLEVASLEAAEAALTGESTSVAKEPAVLPSDTPLADRRNMVFAGTHITAGRARAVVIATGSATEIGKIAALASAAVEPMTPLERRIAQFGRYLVVAAVAVFLLVVGMGWIRGLSFAQIFMVAISQMVSMVPEGLPVAMTIALAVGVQRMARRRAIVRRLAAVETLGSTTVICTDKTGTLTRNEMTAKVAYLPGGRELRISGVGYSPEGHVMEGGTPVTVGDDEELRILAIAALLCNDTRLLPPETPSGQWRALGDPTEAALVTMSIKAGLSPDEVGARYPRRKEIPFDPGHKMMATEHQGPEDPWVILKGAPEQVVPLCAWTGWTGSQQAFADAASTKALEATQRMASEALRVLAFAAVRPGRIESADFAQFRNRATFLGLAGQFDPPRPEAAEAVRACQAAGIRPVVVTGDHRATALAVARLLGIAREEDAVVDGQDLERMSKDHLAARLERISVFARVHPAQKLRIVEAYQNCGEVVAVTGDGVNDAPALARADVGVAMGITGTEVAKDVAKIVITDDNFATIVAAVEEGRVVYRNLKKVVLYLVSTSSAEVVILTLALLLGYPPPLAAVQILWINIVTEGTVTVNLVMEPPEGHEMGLKPVPRNEPLLTRPLLFRMAVMTPAIALSTLSWFMVRLAAGVPFPQVQSETFTVLAVCQWFNVLNCRSEFKSALDFSVLRNPWLVGGLVLSNVLQAAVIFWKPLSDMFHTVPIPLEQVFAIGASASLVLWVEELRKYIVRRRQSVLNST